MITNLTISNFKSIKDLSLELSTINVFIGQNRSGKSSVQQAFGLLKQSPEREINWNGNVVNLKDFTNVLNNKTKTNLISIRFGGIDYASANLEKILDVHKIEFGINYEIEENELNAIDYGIATSRFNIDGRITPYSEGRDKKNIEIPGANIKIKETLSVQSPLIASGGSYSAEVKPETYNIITKAVDELTGVFTKHIQNFVFVPVLRGFDSTTYPLSDKNPESVPTGEGLSKQSEQAASSFAYNKPIEEKVSMIMSKIIPDIKIEHRLSPKKVSMVSVDKHGEYNISSEGFGLNQLCFLFQQLVIAKKNSLVFIEEPEIALHPAAHADVCNALIEEVQRVPKRLIITTHSEHILLGFLEAIMEKRLNPKNLNVFYFEREDGLTKVSPLKVTEKGELIGGLKGFFEADMKHLDRFLNSMKKK